MTVSWLEEGDVAATPVGASRVGVDAVIPAPQFPGSELVPARTWMLYDVPLVRPVMSLGFDNVAVDQEPQVLVLVALCLI